MLTRLICWLFGCKPDPKWALGGLKVCKRCGNYLGR